MKEQKVFRASKSQTFVIVQNKISQMPEVKVRREFRLWLKNVLKEDTGILDELSLR